VHPREETVLPTFPCPNCKHDMGSPPISEVGKWFRCPKCRQRFQFTGSSGITHDVPSAPIPTIMPTMGFQAQTTSPKPVLGKNKPIAAYFVIAILSVISIIGLRAERILHNASASWRDGALPPIREVYLPTQKPDRDPSLTEKMMYIHDDINLSDLKLEAEEFDGKIGVPLISGRVRNMGNRIVSKLTLKTDFKDMFGRTLVREIIPIVSVDEEPLKPHSVKDFRYSANDCPSGWNPNNAQYEIDDIEF